MSETALFDYKVCYSLATPNIPTPWSIGDTITLPDGSMFTVISQPRSEWKTWRCNVRVVHTSVKAELDGLKAGFNYFLVFEPEPSRHDLMQFFFNYRDVVLDCS